MVGRETPHRYNTSPPTANIRSLHLNAFGESLRTFGYEFGACRASVPAATRTAKSPMENRPQNRACIATAFAGSRCRKSRIRILPPSVRLRDRSARAARASIVAAWLALLGCGLPNSAKAQVEVEVDPFAYALNGYSLHVAQIVGNSRLSVGIFGIDVPRFLHGEDDWRVVMRGAGVKWDLIGSPSGGFFAGVDAGYMRMSNTLDAIGETRKSHVINIGLRGGYRWSLGWQRLYMSPWVGIGYSFGEDVHIDGRTFDHRPISVFPTVHVGRRF